MADPNDFVDEKESEGESPGNPKAGQEGVGGLSTKDAEDAYKRAAAEHFRQDTPPTKPTHPKKKKK